MKGSRFGNAIRKLRIAKQKTLQEMAQLLDVSVSYYSEVELGKRGAFKAEKIRLLASELDADFEQLFNLAWDDKQVIAFDTKDYELVSPQIEDDYRATQPPQAAVGEGELPPLNPTISEEAEATKWFPSNRLARLEREARLCRERQLHEAIAQRDEARKGYRCYHCKRMFPEDTTHFGKYEELPKCLEHIRSGSGGDCHDAYIRVRRDVWESMTTVSPAVAGAIQRFNKRADELGLNHHVEIPNSAALDVPKPESEEIERLLTGRMTWKEWNTCASRASELMDQDGADMNSPQAYMQAICECYTARLRSLPSEPAGKAGENAK